MKPRLIKSLLSALFFFSGFISCTSEKEVIYQKDPFSTGGLKVENEDKSYVNAPDITSLKVGSTLQIESLAGIDFSLNPIDIQVDSECRQEGNGKTTYNLNFFRNTASLKVIEILPRQLLLSLNSETPVCNFRVTIANEFSSRVITDFPDIKILGLAEQQNLDIPLFTHSEEAQILSYENLRDVSNPLPEASTVYFHCEEFDKTIDSETNFFLGRLLLDSEEVQSRVTHTLQSCRMLVDEKNNRKLSRIFKMQFPITTPQFIVDSKFSAKNPRFSNPQLLSVTIYNQRPYPVKIKMSDLSQSQFQFKGVYHRGAGYAGTTHTLPLAWNFQIPMEESSEDSKSFIVPAKQYVKFDASAAGSYNCATEHTKVIGEIAPPNAAFTYVGLNYDFKIPTLQLVGDDGSVEAMDFSYTKTPHETESELKYWDIYSYDYASVFQITALPPEIKSNMDAVKIVQWAESFDACRPM